MPDTAKTLELVTVPCLSDNYAFLVHNAATGQTGLVDAPEAAPIQAVLDQRGWLLTDVLLTHHHWDHVDGLEALRATHSPRIIGAAADAHRLPPLDLAVSEGERFNFCGADADVFDVSGHTIGHIAVHLPHEELLFTADSLMALGCGRLFEGTPSMMWQSMHKLRGLPGTTTVCSGHEYTQSNARFAVTVDPNNAELAARVVQIDAARAAGQPTVPSTLDLERRTNPFLRADNTDLQAAIGMAGADPAAVFAEIRGRKDKF